MTREFISDKLLRLSGMRLSSLRASLGECHVDDHPQREYLMRRIREEEAVRDDKIKMIKQENKVEWQPIETAPKDRVVILSDGETRWFSDIDETEEDKTLLEWVGWDRKPTHWFDPGFPTV